MNLGPGRVLRGWRVFFAAATAIAALALLPVAASAGSSFNGSSCTSTENCFAVGSSGSSGAAQFLIEQWNGTSWTKPKYSPPSGAIESRLNAISCRSTTSCMAVGSYVDSGKATHPLALMWNGSTWAQTASSPQPSGSSGAELLAVTCPAGTTGCGAAGSYTDSGGKKHGLAPWWNGTSWSELSLPMPEGATSSEFSGTACTTATSCHLAGSYIDASGTRKPLDLKLNTEVWVLKTTPLPSGAGSGQLEDISCVSSSCIGVGSYLDSSKVTKTFALTYSSETWSLTTPPVPSEATFSQLAGVSCNAVSECEAVGSFERSSEVLPMAISWNGTAWSEQTVESRSFGALTAPFAAVSCPSPSACQAVGSLTYGQSGVNRAFAYKLSGGTWSSIGADGYQREWSSSKFPTASEPEAGEQADVACPSSSFCVRVGTSITGSTRASKAKSWNGSSWTTMVTPGPSEATATELSGVACTSTSSCRAVGNYVSSGVTKPLSLEWGGSKWTVTSTPVPAEATSSSLTAISCTSSSSCRAVGSYVSGGVSKTLSLAWNGTTWSVTTTPNPKGATSSKLTGISCASSGSCQAVGSYVESGTTKTLDLTWTGSAWSVTSTPNPPGAKESVLNDVSCPTTSFCLAVGKEVTSLKTQVIAERLISGTWYLLSFAENYKGEFPPKSYSKDTFSSVWCVSATECRAAGEYTEGAGESVREPFVAVWSEAIAGLPYWETQYAQGPIGSRSAISGIACASATNCLAVGSTKYGAYATEELASSSSGEHWTLSDPPTVSSRLHGVACATSMSCISVGQKLVGSTSEQKAFQLSGEGWNPMTMPVLSNSSLNDIICTNSSHCTAVGSQTSGSLAERWSGSSWSVQTTPNPSEGSAIALNSVSCPTTSNCHSVGRYTLKGAPLVALAEEWNGTSWEIQNIPTPNESNENWLEDISCTSSSYCVAVGDYAASSGAKYALIERWNGSNWRIYKPPAPQGATRTDLTGVSCVSASVCTAVGDYWTSGGSTWTYVLRWNGTSWSIQESPNPIGASAAGLYDVSCVSSAACVAVGSQTVKSSISTLAMSWDGNAWVLGTAPTSPGSTSTPLEAVSCVHALDCAVVGWGSYGRAWEFALQSVEAKQETPDTILLSGPSGEVSGTATFTFGSSESSPGYECSLDGTTYTGCSSPKSYSELSNGSHTFKVRAVDLVSNQDVTPAESTFSSNQPPETTITSPSPTYTNHEEGSIEFTSSESGSTFKCGLDSAKELPTTSCTSPYKLPGHLAAGWHTFVVAATDSQGKSDPTPAKWVFNTGSYPTAPSTNKLVYPEAGKKTASYYTLKAAWDKPSEGEGVTGVSFQMELPKWKAFKTVPAECVIDGKGQQVSWPLAVTGISGQTTPVFLKVRGCAPFKEAEYPEEEIKFRAVFDGGKNAAGASEPVATEYVYEDNANRVPTDATESIGPGSLDLLTGAYTISRTDVSIPVPGSQANLEFKRVYDSTLENNLSGYSTVLGGAWQPSSPVESEAGGEAWKKLEEQVVPATSAVYEKECWNKEYEEVTCGPANEPCDEAHFCEKWEVESARPEERWMELFDSEGAGISFKIIEEAGVKHYIAPEEAKELKLMREDAEHIVLSEPNGTHTTFIDNGGPEYLPKTVSFQASPTSDRMVYENVKEVGLRLAREIAPAPTGVACEDWTSIETKGCRTLSFEYIPAGHGYPSWWELLTSITYYDATGESKHPHSQVVAQYSYGPYLELTEEWDPRLPSLKEKYGYKVLGSGKLTSLTPPGEEPWQFEYEYETGCCTGKTWLKSVSRASLVASEPTATTTIAYNVPISGSSAPYDMSASTVAAWGQTDYPVDATAIFPPTEIPSSPPSSYAKATVKYMDPEGHLVNTASPQLPGASGPSITTAETDEQGNVIRTLGAQARLTVLAASNPLEVAQELETKRKYSSDGTELLEEWGPLHEVKLESGGRVEARTHRTLKYDEGAEEKLIKENDPRLVTTETTGALIEGQSSDVETRVKKTEYNWELLMPATEIVDPNGLNLKTKYVYEKATGLLKERRLPGNPEGGDAHTTKTIYYTAGANSEDSECGNKPAWANLPCKVLPAAQPTPIESNPGIPITKYASYSSLDAPTEITETTGGELQRTTTKTYDTAGRPVKTKITGAGQSLPAIETVYSPTTGRPFKQQFVCEAPESCTGFDNQATTVTYNAIGQAVEYEDADGNKSSTGYDVMGRPALTSDGKGTQTTTYDPVSGAPTQIADSAAGTFTASYNADGQIVAAGLPDGLTAETTYNSVGAPIHKRYQKTSSCISNCTWFNFGVEESIYGQWLTETNGAESNEYSYDKAGRLTLVKERPEGTSCTTRTYAYDADSNRTKLTTRSPGAEGACDTTSGGTAKGYIYDTADRLISGGTVYDKLGRITSLPEVYAGGSGTLTTSYYVNNLVRSQTQNGLTNTYELDASLRQRKSVQSGTKAGNSVFHYADGSDSPAWIEEKGKWTRNIGAFEGLAAIQESSGTTTLQLTDLHGDVVGTASLESGASGPLSAFKFDEFGDPKQSSSPRYGWLGGQGRRTELPSGAVQMGVRSYVPSIGRFLSPDPVQGGSANNYDYANQDPLGTVDLTGERASRNCATQTYATNGYHDNFWGSSKRVAQISIRVHWCWSGNKLTVVHWEPPRYQIGHGWKPITGWDSPLKAGGVGHQSARYTTGRAFEGCEPGVNIGPVGIGERCDTVHLELDVIVEPGGRIRWGPNMRG